MPKGPQLKENPSSDAYSIHFNDKFCNNFSRAVGFYLILHSSKGSIFTFMLEFLGTGNENLAV